MEEVLIWQESKASMAINTFSGETGDPCKEAIPWAWWQSVLICPQVGMGACWVAWVGQPGIFLRARGSGGVTSCMWSWDICLVGGSIPCSSRVSDVSCLHVGSISLAGGGSRGRGGLFLFRHLGSWGIWYPRGWDMANQLVWNPNWRICILWKNISISLTTGYQQVGPFHCPERRSLHFTNGFALNCSGHQWRSIAIVPAESAFKIFITKRACFKIWWWELYLNSPSFCFCIWIFNAWRIFLYCSDIVSSLK